MIIKWEFYRIYKERFANSSYLKNSNSRVSLFLFLLIILLKCICAYNMQVFLVLKMEEKYIWMVFLFVVTLGILNSSKKIYKIINQNALIEYYLLNTDKSLFRIKQNLFLTEYLWDFFQGILVEVVILLCLLQYYNYEVTVILCALVIYMFINYFGCWILVEIKNALSTSNNKLLSLILQGVKKPSYFVLFYFLGQNFATHILNFPNITKASEQNTLELKKWILNIKIEYSFFMNMAKELVKNRFVIAVLFTLFVILLLYVNSRETLNESTKKRQYIDMSNRGAFAKYLKLSFVNIKHNKNMHFILGNNIYYIATSFYCGIMKYIDLRINNKTFLLFTLFLIITPIYHLCESLIMDFPDVFLINGEYKKTYMWTFNRPFKLFVYKLILLLYSITPIIFINSIIIKLLLFNISIWSILLIVIVQIVLSILLFSLINLNCLDVPTRKKDNRIEALEDIEYKNMHIGLMTIVFLFINPMIFLPTILYISSDISYKMFLIIQFLVIPLILLFIFLFFLYDIKIKMQDKNFLINMIGGE